MNNTETTTLTATQQHWLTHLNQAQREGKAIAAYAQEHGLSAQAMYCAKGKLQRKGLLETPSQHKSPQRRFIEIIPAPVTQTAPCHLQLPNGITLSWDHHYDPSILTGFIQRMLQS